MKNCTNCGAQLSDDALFCGGCGTAQPSAPVVSVDEPVTSDAPVVSVDEPGVPSAPIAPTPKKKIKPLHLVLIISAGIVLLVLIGALTNWFGLYTPIDRLALAFKKTVTAESYTVEISSGNDEYTVKAVYDEDEETVTRLIESDYYKELYYDGSWYYLDDYYSDINDEDQDDQYKIHESIKKLEDSDWEDILDDTGLDKQVDSDNLEDFFKALYKKYLKDGKWMEDDMGFEKDGNVYTFEPDVETVCDDLLDLARDKEILKSKYEDSLDELEDELEDVEDEIDNLKIEITLAKGYISEINCKIKINGENENLKIEFSDINKTEIDEDEIDDIIDDVKEAIAEDRCHDCGERRWGSDYCYQCSYYCHGCYEYYDEDEMLSDDYCRNCAFFCEDCGDVTPNDDMYYYNGEDLCWDCYYDNKYSYSYYY